jgi:osmoprotectant transport system permease protein
VLACWTCTAVGGERENMWLFLQYYHGRIIAELLRHILIIAISIPCSIIFSVPVGIYISTRPKLARYVIYIAGILMTIPSLALFGIMVVALAPFKAGIGMVPAVIAITLYSLLPITRNTYTALNNVPYGVIDAARGMGLSRKQILWKIKLPLSIPVIMAGIRTSVVLGVSVATFASLVGAGGLGYFIFSGISRSNLFMVAAGAILVSVLGISVNYDFMWFENFITPKGLKVNRK